LAAPDALETALAWLQRGEVIAFPTDTVYGLGAPMDDAASVARLFSVKGRPLDMGIPLLLAEPSDVARVCPNVPEVTWRLAERFWPGGLTLVLPRGHNVPDVVAAGGSTIAVRLPAHPLPRDLARRLGVPLAATSANLHGEASPVSADDVRGQLGGRIPLILDGGPCPQARSSTIVDLTGRPRFLREGPISREQIEALLGRPLLDSY
jgi:L-threonylcarbamoyladenylate synthase